MTGAGVAGFYVCSVSWHDASVDQSAPMEATDTGQAGCARNAARILRVGDGTGGPYWLRASAARYVNASFVLGCLSNSLRKRFEHSAGCGFVSHCAVGN